MTRAELLACSAVVDVCEQRLADAIGRCIERFIADTGTGQQAAVELFSAALANIAASEHSRVKL